ncbi:MAG TPA: phosphoglucosamine mutase, partial [Acidimicrobiales bacterium]|nr:phosphoglucosamine mutase [Acidimicrobiales bacterium]
VDLGVLPTPGVAWVSADRAIPAAVVSASHNLFADNGVKLFAAGGCKLSDSVEASVEAELHRILSGAGQPVRPTGHAVGVLRAEPEAADTYADHLVSLAAGTDLGALHVVVDCANGAASTLAPAVLRRLGARVDTVFDRPDGININAGCGSTHPEALSAEVRARQADVGLALDGDADRLVAVDHGGELVTGDELLAMFALDLSRRGELAGDAVVVTVMSNLGLRLAMEAHGITVRETPVGDRYVLEALEADGLSLGGEQSGHVVFRRLSTTGDGTLTAVLLLELLARSGQSLAELAEASMQRLPQVLSSVAVDRPAAVVESDPVRQELDAVRLALGESGRVVLRASGTEPVVRVMVEATDHRSAAESAERLVRAVTTVAEAEARRSLSP